MTSVCKTLTAGVQTALLAAVIVVDRLTYCIQIAYTFK